MAKLVKSASNYVLRRKVQNTTLGSIYERDWMTVSEMDWYADGLLPVWQSGNFKMTINQTPSTRKKYSYGNWETKDGDEFWTLENTDIVEVKVDTTILKPKYSSITDFACYGSATELVRASVSDIIKKFPGEIYFTDEEYAVKSPTRGYIPVTIGTRSEVGANHASSNRRYQCLVESTDESKRLFVVNNPFMIDINTEFIRESDVENPDRYFALSLEKYEVVFDENGPNERRFDLCWTPKNPKNDCPIDYDILFTANLEFTKIYGVKTPDGILFLHDGSCKGFHIRMKEKYVSEAFDRMDDFERVLLNRETKPRYRAVFESPIETDFGTVITRKAYIWPLIGGWNIDINGILFENYFQKLLSVCKYYDEYRTDSLWRAMVHESIKNFDWTSYIDTEVPEIDGETIDEEKIPDIMRVYGRQFDDLKRYIEGIAATANVSYNEENNIQDKILAKMLEMDGWEVKDVAPFLDNGLSALVSYPGKNLYPSPEDGNLEFMRRLALNSRNLLSRKGTISGLRTMLSFFGIPEIGTRKYGSMGEWWKSCEINKTGYTLTEFDVMASSFPSGNTVSEIKAINAKKDNFQKRRKETLDDYVGLMTSELVVADESGDTVTYLVPWVDKERRYDGNPYFQMFGGWWRKDRKKVHFSAVPDLKIITGSTSNISTEVSFPIYDETVKNIHIVQDTEKLTYINPDVLSSGDVYYCVDIQGYYTKYPDTEPDSVSNYFVLNPVGSGIPSIPYSDSLEWQPVFYSDFEIIGQTNIYGDTAIRANNAAKVVYLESITDTVTGNNPHNGKSYDGGQEYFEYFNTLFRADTPDKFSKYRAGIISANLNIEYNNRYNGTTTALVPDVTSAVTTNTKYGFGTVINGVVNYAPDSQKVWFFFDDNTKDDWYGGIYSRKGTKRDQMRETDEYIKENASSYSESEFKEKVAEFKQTIEQWNGFSEESLDYEQQGIVLDKKKLPITPKGETGNTELVTYSVINSKRFVIKFFLSNYYRDYIEEVVEFYLKQMVPSTTIVEFEWESADKGLAPQESCYSGTFSMVGDDGEEYCSPTYCYSEVFGMVGDDNIVFGVLPDESGGVPEDATLKLNPDVQIVNSTTTSATLGVARKNVNKETIGVI